MQVALAAARLAHAGDGQQNPEEALGGAFIESRPPSAMSEQSVDSDDLRPSTAHLQHLQTQDAPAIDVWAVKDASMDMLDDEASLTLDDKVATAADQGAIGAKPATDRHDFSSAIQEAERVLHSHSDASSPKSLPLPQSSDEGTSGWGSMRLNVLKRQGSMDIKTGLNLLKSQGSMDESRPSSAMSVKMEEMDSDDAYDFSAT